MLINLRLNLRWESGQGYRIPQGVLFRWVSSPNLLGEIVEWSGFALMVWTVWTLPTKAFTLWTGANLIPRTFAMPTIANLIPRALVHHQWYLQEFPAPEEPKAIILAHHQWHSQEFPAPEEPKAIIPFIL